jgi:hypothetical protein
MSFSVFVPAGCYRTQVISPYRVSYERRLSGSRQPTHMSKIADRRVCQINGRLDADRTSLSASLFSWDWEYRRELAQRLVLGASRALSHASQHHCLGKGMPSPQPGTWSAGK